VQTRLSWALFAAGALGFIWALASVLPGAVALGAIPGSSLNDPLIQRVFVLTDGLPQWLQWQGGTNLAYGTGAGLLVVVLLSVLLLVGGGWAARSFAILGLAGSAYVVTTFGPGAYWARTVADSGSATPLLVMTLVSLVLLTVLSSLAVLTAISLRREVNHVSDGVVVPVEQALPADGVRSEQQGSDAIHR
jgi:hypothetical protein